jgi:hypothetical protein
MSNYYEKYMKYKMKYLSLKGGMPTGKLYLPCEIDNKVMCIYSATKYVNTIKDIMINYPGKSFNQNFDYFTILSEYKQDPAIFLKDENNKNYILIVRNDIIDSENKNLSERIEKIENIENIEYKYTKPSGNDYGGNFISSPGANNYTFCFENINNDLQLLLNNTLVNKLVELKCSFRYNGERHIDECMCFMPYNNGSYKIWIYKIRNISFKNDSNSHLKIQYDTLFNNLIRNIDIIINNDLKSKLKIGLLGFNKLDYKENIAFIGKIETLLNNELSDNPELIAKILTSLNKINSDNPDMNVIKLIRTFIQSLPLCHKTELKKPPINNSDDILNYIKSNLETERILNIETISNILFKEYKPEMFVEFPIDLEINDNNYLITKPPIFNRVCINLNNDIKEYLFLFSQAGEVDPEVMDILNKEKIKMNPNNIYEFIDISNEYKTDVKVGGGLHCLIKTQY